MALKTIVKVSSVNSLSDARFCAGMAVDMVGFCLDHTSDKFVDHKTYGEIVGWITGVKYVAEFNEHTLVEMNKILKEYPVHMLELSKLDTMREIKQNIDESGVKPLEIIFKVDWKDPDHEIYMSELRSYVTYFQIEINATDLQKEATYSHLKHLSNQYPVLLSGGVEVSNLDKVLDTPVKGIAMQGGEETKPGFYKNFDDLADVLEALDID